MHENKYDVYIVDDHAIVREGLVRLINDEENLLVCGEAADGPSAIKALSGMRPDVAIIDLSLSSMAGLDVIKAVKALHPALPILVFSMHEESIFAERALRAGASGYLMKSEPPLVLISALRRVLSGKLFLSERMTESLLYKAIDGGPSSGHEETRHLSDREMQVLQLIGKGLKTREIAERFNLSVKTIDAFRENIKRKLNLKSASELVQYAIEWSHNEGMR